MRVALRADGGAVQGTGHIMRCLTLAEALRDRGHEVVLICNELDVAWLSARVVASGVEVHPAPADVIDVDAITALQPDWVVTDSYRFSSRVVNTLAKSVRVLALVDGDERGLDVQLYLDQNLGAEARAGGDARKLFGSRYALVRDDILSRRRAEPWHFETGLPRVLSVMGGSDPTHASVRVAGQLARFSSPLDITMVVPDSDHEDVASHFELGNTARIVSPTPELPALLAAADIVISAAGTSAWDVCALGVPAILVAVVDNQLDSLEQAVARGLTAGISAVDDDASISRNLLVQLRRLLDDEAVRRRFSVNCAMAIDGLGKVRVVERLEQAARD